MSAPHPSGCTRAKRHYHEELDAWYGESPFKTAVSESRREVLEKAVADHSSNYACDLVAQTDDYVKWRILRGYRATNGGAIGFVASIDVADVAGSTTLRVYTGFITGTHEYADCLREIGDFGYKLSPGVPFERAIIRTLFPEFKDWEYAR